MDSNRTEANILLPTLVVALGALLVFTSTLSFYPFPGESAAMLVRYGGLDPLPTAYHPLYAGVAQLFARLPMGTLALRIGMISTLCGAACVALLFGMMAQLRFRQVHDDEAPLLPLMAGLPAAGYLLFAPPFWASANRAHPILFHLCFLLAGLMLLQRYGRTARMPYLGAAAFLFGLFLLEWAGSLLIVPFVIAAAGLYMYGNRHLHPDREFVPLVAFTLGVVTFIALFYARLSWATANLVDPPTLRLGPALFTLVGEHLVLLEHAFDGIDLVLIAIGSVVPWLVAMVCARQEAESEAYSGAVVLHLVLTLLCLILLFLGSVSPGMVNDLHSLAAVPPVLAIASVFGYVIGYWYLLADRAWGGEKPAVMTRVIASIGVAVCAILATSVRVNMERTSTRLARATHQWAAAVLLPLPDDAVVIAPAGEQNLLAVTAREQSRSLVSIDLSRANDPEYRTYIAGTLVPAELRDLAAYSLLHFLEAWTRHPAYPAERVFTTDDPDFFERAARSFESIPAGYLDLAAPATHWTHDRLAQHQSFWQQTIPALRAHQTAPGFPGKFCHSLIQKAARNANDLGLLAREHGAFSDAHTALRAARSMNADNLPAAANAFLLLSQAGQAEEAASTWPSIEALISAEQPPAERTADGKLIGASRLRAFAQVRPPSRERLPDSPIFRAALAAYLLEDASTAETIGPILTREHPNHRDAWLLAGLMATERRDTNHFAECTRELVALKTDPTSLLVAAARQAADQKNLSWAKDLMQDALTRQPADLDVLETVAALELLAPTPAPQPVYLHRLLSLDPDNAMGHYALGARLLLEGDPARARQEILNATARGDIPNATLLAALLTDDADGPVPEQTARLAMRAMDADVGDPHYWEALQGIFARMEFPGAVAFSAAKAERPADDSPASLAFARLLAATRSTGPIQVVSATTPEPVPSAPPPPSPADDDLHALLNQVVKTDQTSAPAAADARPPIPPPPVDLSNLDDEEAPVPLAW